ncbi:MAG: hypothetical protein V7750_15140 [Sneathiella sp.]
MGQIREDGFNGIAVTILEEDLPGLTKSRNAGGVLLKGTRGKFGKIVNVEMFLVVLVNVKPFFNGHIMLFYSDKYLNKWM